MSLLGQSLEQDAADCGCELLDAGTQLSEIKCRKCKPKLKEIWPVLIAWSYRLRSFKRNAFALIGLGALGLAGWAGTLPSRAAQVSSAEASSAQVSLAQVKSAQVKIAQVSSDEHAPDAPVWIPGYWRKGFWVEGHYRSKPGSKMKAAE